MSAPTPTLRDIADEVRRRISTRAYAEDHAAEGRGAMPRDFTCPLCKRPKKRRFRIYDGRGCGAHCCGLSGSDVIALHGARVGLDYRDAILDLARLQGVSIDGFATLTDAQRAAQPALSSAVRASWRPALVGAIAGPEGGLISLHRTFLDGPCKAADLPTETSSAKCMLGAADGGAVRLSPFRGCFRLDDGTRLKGALTEGDHLVGSWKRDYSVLCDL